MNTTENFRTIKGVLTEANTNFFAFTPKEDKYYIYLLKELDYSFEKQFKKN